MRGQGCMCGVFVSVTPLGREPESSLVHGIAVSHLFIKVCISSSGTFAECMEDFALSQPENPCTVVPARYALAHLEMRS